MATLEGLPMELLGPICHELSNRDGRPTPWLLNLASQSWKLRQAASPFVFHTMSMSFEEYEDRDDLPARSRTTLTDFINGYEHVAPHIRHIDIRTPPLKDTDYHEVERFKAVLPKLANLKLIRFRKFDEKALTSFAELNLGYEVAIDMYASPRKSHQMDVLSAISNVVSVGIVTDYIEHLKRLFAIQPKLRRLAIVCKNSSSSTTHEDLSHESYLTTKDDSYNVPPVTELHLDGLLGITPYSPSVRSNQVNERIALLNNVQWHLLRSLNLNSGLLIERFLTHYGDRLSSVRHLSLSVYDSSQDDPWAEHLGGVEATANFFRTSRFAQRLLSLELRGYTLRFPLSCIKSPTLQTLRFHNYENDGRALANSIRPASDIRHLAQNCPDLCYLAIDFPNLKNLFHPAAIPGVETDLAVYPFLQAIAEIPKLSHLHLFPPYAQMVAGRITYAQPFTDDDMVIRLFKHIKTYQILHKQSQSAESSNPFFNTISETSPLSPSLFAPPQYPHPTLKHLLITSDNLFASWVHPFNPQSWHVFEPSNGRFFMTLRQSERDYEQRQVWEGERRLRTEIRRDRYPRHYQSGFPDGTGLGWFDMS